MSQNDPLAPSSPILTSFLERSRTWGSPTCSRGRLIPHFESAPLSQAPDQQLNRHRLQGHLTLYVLWFGGRETTHAIAAQNHRKHTSVCSGIGVRERGADSKCGIAKSVTQSVVLQKVCHKHMWTAKKMEWISSGRLWTFACIILRIFWHISKL